MNTLYLNLVSIKFCLRMDISENQGLALFELSSPYTQI